MEVSGKDEVLRLKNFRDDPLRKEAVSGRHRSDPDACRREPEKVILILVNVIPA